MNEGLNPPVPVELRWRTVLKAAPSGLLLPDSYRAVIEGELPDIRPAMWFLEQTDLLESWVDLLRRQYPDRRLFPFAGSTLDDDVYCWDARDEVPGIVHLIHSFSEPGWEERGYWLDFDEWYRAAQADHERWRVDEG